MSFNDTGFAYNVAANNLIAVIHYAERDLGVMHENVLALKAIKEGFDMAHEDFKDIETENNLARANRGIK